MLHRHTTIINHCAKSNGKQIRVKGRRNVNEERILSYGWLSTHIPPMVTVAQVRSEKAGTVSVAGLAALM